MILRLPHAAPAGFGKYRLIAKLGQGGMAEVFLAAHRGPLGFEKLVVIKRIKPGIAAEPDVNKMFLDEARLAARLNHPNVVQTYECGQVDEQYYIVMEYLEGQSLDRISSRLDPFVYRAAYLSMISDAKWATRDADTSTGVVKGKIRYMAPEQALASPVDRRADIFAMGLIFWEVVVGERFWGDLSDVQILQRLTCGEILRFRDRWRAAPEALDQICSRALSMRPEGRYATAAQMRDDVEAYLATLGRPSSAEIGRLLADAFACVRAEVKAAVSEQLGRLHDEPAEVEGVEVLPVLEDRGAGPRSQPQPHSGAPPNPHAHAPPVRRASPLEGAPIEERAAHDSRSSRTTVTAAGAHGSTASGQVTRWGRALAAVVLLLAGVAAAWALYEPQPPEQQQIVQPSVEPGRLVELRIIATPPDAKIFLDDVALQQNPFFARFERDGTGHRVRVTADGYAPEARLVVFARDEVLTFNLRPADKAEPPLAPVPSASARLAPSVSRTGPGAPGRIRSTIPLDTELP
jgi:eukaryotic-like serine/threonine-protein kinase